MKIEISKRSYKILENIAVERGTKVEKVLKDLIKRNKNGIPFDVDFHDDETCENVFLDIIDHFNKKSIDIISLVSNFPEKLEKLNDKAIFFEDSWAEEINQNTKLEGVIEYLETEINVLKSRKVKRT